MSLFDNLFDISETSAEAELKRQSVEDSLRETEGIMAEELKSQEDWVFYASRCTNSFFWYSFDSIDSNSLCNTYFLILRYKEKRKGSKGSKGNKE